MNKSLYIMLIALVLSVVVVVASVDDEGNPNDPRINERANACYVGGSLEGKCTTDVEWQAGWYLIRYEYGLISRQSFPVWAQWVLPEESILFVTLTPTPFPTSTPLPP